MEVFYVAVKQKNRTSMRVAILLVMIEAIIFTIYNSFVGEKMNYCKSEMKLKTLP
ncbi:hypothetical protein [Planococcus sp. S3-L1]|uniref:hypothetical protein n=1 Tax=Planococcus sp. S3-L1 TaxID=3046200 RepID=UPI0032D5AC31